MKKIHYVNSNHKMAGVAILTSDKTDLWRRNVTGDEEASMKKPAANTLLYGERLSTFSLRSGGSMIKRSDHTTSIQRCIEDSGQYSR